MDAITHTTPTGRAAVITAFDIALGRIVRERREAVGLSQLKLGNQLGKTWQQLQKYEKGLNRISVATLVTICRATDSDPGQMIQRAIAEVDGGARGH